MSKGGKAIIALASRTNKGKPKIVPLLQPGAGVVTPRADVQWVVTEHGAVNLYGKSLQERSKLLISIAHPEDRETLEKASFERYCSIKTGLELYKKPLTQKSKCLYPKIDNANRDRQPDNFI